MNQVSRKSPAEPTANAAQFRLINPTASQRHFAVSWMDQVDGRTIEVRRNTKMSNKGDAQRLLKKLYAKAERLRPRAEFCTSRQLYVLHCYVGGKLTRRSLGTRDPAEVDGRMQQRLAELGLTPKSSELSVGDMLDRYWAGTHATKPPARTRVCQRSLKLLREFFTDDKLVQDITGDDYLAYQEWRMKTVAAATVGVEFDYWIAALNFATKHKLIGLDRVPVKPVRPAREEGEKLVVTKEDWQAIVAVAENMPQGSATTGRLGSLELYLHMVRYTGGRISFYESLLWDRIDFENKTINFALLGVAQTKKRRPTVPMGKALEAILRRAWFERDEANKGHKFVLWQRKNFQEQMKSLKAAMAATGDERLVELSEKLHSHAFRRSFVTWAVTEGWSPWLIGQVTGQSAQIIEKVYAIYRPNAAMDLVNKI